MSNSELLGFEASRLIVALCGSEQECGLKSISKSAKEFIEFEKNNPIASRTPEAIHREFPKYQFLRTCIHAFCNVPKERPKELIAFREWFEVFYESLAEKVRTQYPRLHAGTFSSGGPEDEYRSKVLKDSGNRRFEILDPSPQWMSQSGYRWSGRLTHSNLKEEELVICVDQGSNAHAEALAFMYDRVFIKENLTNRFYVLAVDPIQSYSNGSTLCSLFQLREEVAGVLDAKIPSAKVIDLFRPSPGEDYFSPIHGPRSVGRAVLVVQLPEYTDTKTGDYEVLSQFAKEADLTLIELSSLHTGWTWY